MRKIIQTLFIFFIVNPLSAQVDSGYIKCNLDFIQYTIALDSSNLNPEQIKINYNGRLNEWNKCIKSYKVPDFKILTVNNDTFSLNNSNNKVIVLNFWSLNCPPCFVELKVLNALCQEYNTEEVLFVSLAPNSKKQIMNYINSKIVTIANANEIFNLYGIYGYPQTIILRKNHMIKHQFLGINVDNIDKFKEDLKIQIKEALLE